MTTVTLRRWILTLGAVVAIGPLSIDMYLPALPELQRHFATGAAEVQLTLSAFFAGLAIGQLVYGPLSDRYGRRPPLLAGLALYTIASLVCALAPSIDALIGLRFVQAAGGCAGMVITRAMVRDRFEPMEMARILSLLVLVMGAAPILAPVLGSAVLEALDWHAIFVALALFGALCLVLIAGGIEETLPATRRLAQISLRSVSAGYLHLLSHRRFMGYALAGGIAQGGMFAYIAASAFVFIEVYGLSPGAFGILFGSNAAGLIAASQLNRVLLRRHAAQRIMRAAIGTYLLAGAAMLGSALSGFGGIVGVAVPVWLCLASLGFTFPNSIAGAMAPFGDRAGSASALIGTLQFGIAGVASAVAGHWYDGTAVPMAGVIAFCGAASMLLMLGLAREA